MLFIILSFFKNFFNAFITFASTKLGQIVIIAILGLILLFSSYKYGLNKGINEEKANNQILINKAIAEQVKRSQIEKEEAIKLVESQKKTETVYIESGKKIDTIIKRNPKLSNKDCSLNKQDAIDYNKALDEIN